MNQKGLGIDVNRGLSPLFHDAMKELDAAIDSLPIKREEKINTAQKAAATIALGNVESFQYGMAFGAFLAMKKGIAFFAGNNDIPDKEYENLCKEFEITYDAIKELRG